MENMVEVSNVVYAYRKHEQADEHLALKGVNLKVKKGEFLVVIGHNGSGKSTLSKHLNAIYLPKEGDVFVNGKNTKNIENLWDIRQSAGMVFQNPDNQIVATIVEEDVAFGPENLGVKPEEIKKELNLH